jgi:hypothetical protein
MLSLKMFLACMRGRPSSPSVASWRSLVITATVPLARQANSSLFFLLLSNDKLLLLRYRAVLKTAVEGLLIYLVSYPCKSDPFLCLVQVLISLQSGCWLLQKLTAANRDWGEAHVSVLKRAGRSTFTKIVVRYTTSTSMLPTGMGSPLARHLCVTHGIYLIDKKVPFHIISVTLKVWTCLNHNFPFSSLLRDFNTSLVI